MGTSKTVAVSQDFDLAPAAPPYPDPIGTPPGGGCWTWDTTNGQWVNTDQKPATAQE